MRNTLRGVVLLVHGSRRLESTQAMLRLSRQLAGAIEAKTITVACAFLELVDPAVDQVIDQMAARGIREILVLPYFLAPGNHVRIDIPELVSQNQERHPEIRIRQLEYIGAHPKMTEFLAGIIEDAIA